LAFCLPDGNVASEDSSLSDALVLEDGRFSISYSERRDTDYTRAILYAVREWPYMKARARARGAAGFP
jgi:hypothetical protein